MSSDATLKQNVVDELGWRPDVDSAHIGVTADNGIVTLSGYVSSYIEKSVATDAVKRVSGVRGVAEKLEVRLPGAAAGYDDDEIAKRALNSLAWDTLVPAKSIQVTVENGIVTLSGEVPWQFQRAGAEDDVRKLLGVVGVVNNVSLQDQPQPSDLKTRIESALNRSADLDARSVRVSVSGGAVTLDGTVDSWTARDLAEDAAWAAPGVRDVYDNLSVVI